MNTKDVIAEARARIKKIAASMLARKVALEAERARLDTARKNLGGDTSELDQRIALKEEEIRTAEKDYEDALEELNDLGRLGKDAERAELRAMIDDHHRPSLPDPKVELEALKAKRQKPAEEDGDFPYEGDDDTVPSPGVRGPKRTL